MFNYLVSREQDEMFRTSVRDIKFPDGTIRQLETYRIVWRWYDRATEYEFGPDKDWLLNLVLKCSDEEGISIDDALGRVLDYVLQKDEADGLDYTDDKLKLLVAKQAMDRFGCRKSSR